MLLDQTGIKFTRQKSSFIEGERRQTVKGGRLYLETRSWEPGTYQKGGEKSRLSPHHVEVFCLSLSLGFF